MILFVASMNQKFRSEEEEPMSERGDFRNSRSRYSRDARISILDPVSNFEESSIHPAWLALSEGGRQPISRVPPALSPSETANVREKRLHLVRYSLLRGVQLKAWESFESHGAQRQQIEKEWMEKQQTWNEKQPADFNMAVWKAFL